MTITVKQWSRSPGDARGRGVAASWPSPAEFRGLRLPWARHANNNFMTPQFASFWQGIRERFDARFVAALEAEYGLN